MPKPGRPTAFKKEYVTQAKKLCALGATDREVADFFGVTERTLNNWKLSHAEFFQSLKQGKEEADDRVEQSLYRKAIGYSFDSEKVFQNAGEIIRAPIVEHVPPSDTAAIFWLKNRRKGSWRDKQDVEHHASDDLAALLAASRQRAAQ